MSMNAASIAAFRKVSIVASRTDKRVQGQVGRSVNPTALVVRTTTERATRNGAQKVVRVEPSTAWFISSRLRLSELD